MFLSHTGLGSSENHKATKAAFIVSLVVDDDPLSNTR